MRQSHLMIMFTPKAAERVGLRSDQARMFGMDDVLDIIESFDLVGQIEHRQLVVRVREETGAEARAIVAATTGA